MKIEKQWVYVDIPKNIADDMGAVWNAKEKSFRLPNTLGVLRELYKLDKTESLLSYGKQKAAQKQELMKLKTLEDAPGDVSLRNYQRVDVQYLKKIGSAGVFNEQRTGKRRLP